MPWSRGEPARVLDDDADPAGQGQVVDDERDLHRIDRIRETARRSMTPRTAYVGQSTFFEACVPPGATFLEHRKDAPRRQARRAGCTSWRPRWSSSSARRRSRRGSSTSCPARPSLGFLTEPLPRAADGTVAHDDLERRLWELGQVDGSGFDRVVAFDPRIAPAADAVLPVWRSVPLPVADRLYARRARALGHAEPAVRRPLDRAPRALPAGGSSTSTTSCTSPSASAPTSSRETMAAPRRRHQPAQRALPELREPRLPAPRRRASRPQRAAGPAPRPRAGHRLRRDPQPRPARARAVDAAPLSRPPPRASACAAGARPSSSAPAASGRVCSADLQADVRAFGGR